jgi:hypothetical protein
MLQTFLCVVAAAIWVRAARLLRAGSEPHFLMQVLVFVASPLICLHIFVVSVTECLLETHDA